MALFSKTYVVPGRDTHHYHKTDVHEHRAPTDKSVELLKEFEKAARDKVIESVKVGDTKFECVVHMMTDAMSQDHLAMAIFSLNGHKMKVTSRQPDFNTTPEQRIEALHRAIADKIAAEILLPALSSLKPR